MTPRRVLIVNRSMLVGGAETWVIQWVRALHARGHAVAVVSLYPGPRDQDIVTAGGTFFCLHKSSRYALFSVVRQLRARIKGWAPEVVLSVGPVGNLFAALACVDQPVRWVGSLLGLDSSRLNYGWVYSVTHRLADFAMRRAHWVLCNSAPVAHKARQSGISADRVIEFAQGIDTDLVYRDRAARARMRALWGIAEYEIVVALVGRLDPVKGHALFIETAQRIKLKESDFRFVCIGCEAGVALSRLKSSAHERGLSQALIWQSPVTDPLDIYSGIDVLVVCSIAEGGMPRVLGEGMAAELPAVVTDVGNAVATLGPCGRVAGANVESLAAAILSLKDASLRATLGRAARQRIIDEFSVEGHFNTLMPILLPESAPCA